MTYLLYLAPSSLIISESLRSGNCHPHLSISEFSKFNKKKEKEMNVDVLDEVHI